MTRALPLLFALAGVGCDDSDARRQRAELDGLVKQRQYLTLHQSNLRMAADAEIAGRPLEQLPPDSTARLTIFQLQYVEAERQLQKVDADIELVQQPQQLY
ncbi:MAG: hypothetical protein U0804_26965 [Gemmataceae bacterium]